MTEMELLTWLCIIGICVAGVMNLRHTAVSYTHLTLPTILLV